MKKILLIPNIPLLLILTQGVFQNIFAQSNSKKMVFYHAKVTNMNKQSENYSVSHFTDSSVVLFPLIKEKNKKVIQPDQKIIVTAADIKRIYLKKDKKIQLSETNTPPHSIDSISENTDLSSSQNIFLKNQKFNNFFSAIGPDLISADPFGLVVGLPLIIIPIWLISPNGQTFSINGKQKNFQKMVETLTLKKKINRA